MRKKYSIINARIFACLFCLLLSYQSAKAANYYWVGGTGVWTDLTHWATTSGGGANPIIVPSSIDDIIFDANSFSPSGGTVTLTFEGFCKSITVDAALSANVTFQFDAGMNVADFVNANPTNQLVWNQITKLECVNNVTFGNVYFNMPSGLFHVLNGNLSLQNAAYFKKQGGNNCTIDNGTFTLAAGSKFEQNDGGFVVGSGDISIPSGAIFTNSANNTIVKEGSFIVASGAIVTIDRQWQIYDGGWNIDPGATYMKNGGNIYLYAEHSGGPYYIRNAGQNIHRLEFGGNDYGVEYHLLEKLTALNDGIFPYANKFISDGFAIDCYHFYAWTGGIVTINLAGTDTVNVRSQFRIYPGGVNMTYMAPNNIKWTGYDNMYFIGGDKINNNLWFNADNPGASVVQFEYPGTINNVTVNANGQQYFELYHNGTINNFSFNHLNAIASSYNPRLVIEGNYQFTGTFQAHSAGTNIRPILDFRGSNTFNIFDVNHLFEWVMNSGTTQTFTDLQPIIGSCAEPVLIHSSYSGLQVNMVQTSGTVSFDWVLLQDINASGGATFSSTNTIDLGNNTGWSISAVAAQTFYWIGGDGNWNDPSHWSLTSGGLAGCASPSRIDNVVFDANSFSLIGQHCTININTAECNHMTWSGITTGTGISGNNTLSIYGNLVCDAGMDWAHNGVFKFQNTTSATLLTNGVVVNSSLQFTGQNQNTAHWNLLDNLTSNNRVYVFNGTFTSNGHNLDVNTFYGENNGVTADFTGSTQIKLVNQWYMWEYTTLILPITCDILFEGSDHMYFHSQGSSPTNKKIYGQVNFHNTNSGGTEIQFRGNYIDCNTVTVNHGGTNRFYMDGADISMNSLIINYTQNVDVQPQVQIYTQNLSTNHFEVNGTALNHPQLETPNNSSYGNAILSNLYSWKNWPGGTRSFTNLTVTSSCSPRTMIQSVTSGTQADISVSGTATCDNCILQDINATGGGTFASTNSAIAANVTGWSAGTGANYYWVGGNGNWNDPTHWSFTSGGPAAGCYPTRVDNVFFDVNSFSAANQTVTIQHNMECKNMLWNNVNNPIVNGGDVFNVYGSFILAPTVTWNFYNWIFFQSRNAGNVINTNGVALHYIMFNGEGTYAGEWTLQGDLKSTDYIFFRSGTFNTNGYSLEAKTLWNDYNDSRIKIDFTGTPEVKLHNRILFYPNPTILASNTNFRFFEQQDGYYSFNNYGKQVKDVIMDAGNSSGTIEFQQTGIYNNVTITTTSWPTINFYHGGIYNDINITYNNPSTNVPQVQFYNNTTVNNLSVSSTGNGGPFVYLNENNTFNNLIAAGLGTRLIIGANRTQTVNGLLALGNGSFPVIFQSNSNGTQGTIYKPSGRICIDFVVMKDILATGGASYYAGASSVNVSNNTNWNFTSCAGFYWVGDNGNWSDYANHWATSSGGSVFHNAVPGPGDDVFFDANSFTTSGRTVNLNVSNAQCHDMKWGSAPFNPSFTGSSVNTMEVFGDLQLIPAMNQSFTGAWKFSAPDNGHTLNTAGRTLNSVTFAGGASGQGDWTLTNPLNVTNTINFDNGTLQTNNKSVSAKNFYSSTANTRSLQLGNSTVTITHGVWDPSTLSDAEFVEGTSMIVMTGNNTSVASAFKGNSLTYNNVTFTTPSSLHSAMTGDNIINTLQIDPGVTLTVDAASTNTMNDLFAIGSCANKISLQSSLAGTPANFVKSSGTVDATFLIVKDMNVSGGAIWNANYSADISGNSGWAFTPYSTLSITTASTWVDCMLNNDGSATVTSVTGGTSPYSYLWSTTETTSSIANLIPGLYTVTVTDVPGCTANSVINVVNTPGLITAVPFTSSASKVCLGTSINFFAGTPIDQVASYLWKFGDFTTSTSPTPTKLYTAGGTYTVSLYYYDANGCPSIVSSTIIISNPTENVTQTSVNCYGANDGTITVSANGGISPFEYSIDNGTSWQSGNTFTGLIPSTYEVFTRDSLGCISLVSQQILSQPSAALSQSLSLVYPSCAGGDGSISISPSGGTPPYLYSINGGIGFVPADNFQTLNPGIYNVVVRDANLCVTLPEAISLGAGAEADIFGNSVVIPDNDVTPLLTDHTDFGIVGLSMPKVRTYKIKNNGNVDLNINSIIVSGVDASLFTSGSLIPASPIPAGDSATFAITFAPTSFGLKSATVTIDNTDCNEASYDFAIQGTGGCGAPTINCLGPVTISNTPGLCTGNTVLTAPSVSVDCSIIGNALNFDGVDDLVTGSDANLPAGTSSRSIESWVKFTSVSPMGPIFKYGNTSVNGEAFELGVHNSGVAYFWGSSADVAGTTLINDGTWHHVAVTYDGTTIKLYVDGNLDASGTPSLSTNLDGSFYMGLDPTTSWSLNGSIDEVRVWNTERTQAEIQANMNSELSAQSGLVSVYHFNQGIAGSHNQSVTTVTDASGNANDGILSNLALSGSTSNWVCGAFGGCLTNDAPSVYPIGNTTVTWMATDANGNTATCTQTVTVVTPEIDVQGSSPLVSILDGDITPDLTDHTDFGNVAINSMLTKTFTIHNIGTADLNISGITSSNSLFVISALNPSSPIAAGNSATIDVTFSPLATGLETSTIAINNNDCNEAVYDFTVSGNGICVAPDLAIINTLNDSVCSGTSTLVSVTGGNLNNASQWQWYSVSCGGTPEGSGSSLNVSPTTTTTYYVRGEGGCVTPDNCSQVTITVNPLPVVSAGSDVSICLGSAVTLTASGASNYTWGPLPAPLDVVSSASLAIGLHKLKSTYSGNAVQLRRSSDNAIMDFGFVGDELDVNSIAIWLGGNTGYCTVMYDQSGNGNDIVQAIPSKQPTYVAAGINGKPILHFTTSQQMINYTNFPSPFSVVYAARQTGPARARVLSSPNNNWLLGWHGGLKSQAFFEGWITGTPTTADNASYVYSATGSGSSSSYFENGILQNTSSNGLQGPNGIQLNGYGGGLGETSDCDFMDVMVFSSELSTSDRALVENTVGTFYSINTPGTYAASQINVSPLLTTTYTVTGANAYGCTATSSVTVTVNTPPVITCPSDITVTLPANVCDTIVTYSVTATGNGPITYSYSQESGTLFHAGTRSVSVTVTDLNGCTSSCSFLVTVIDAELPVLSSCPSPVTLNIDPGQCGAVVNFSVPTATDPCGGALNQAFSYTGNAQTFTVPAGVTSIQVKTWGAGGGGGGNDGQQGGAGGGGAYSTSTLSVTPGQVLTLYVGAGGTHGDGCNSNSGHGTGGFGYGNGADGGDAGENGCSGGGGGGGGASAVLIGSTPVLIAAGGGGGGGGGNDVVAGAGGGGGMNGSANSSNSIGGLAGASSTMNGDTGANRGINDGGAGGGGGGGVLGGGGGSAPISGDASGAGGAGGTSLGVVVNGNNQTPGNSAALTSFCSTCASGGASTTSGGNGLIVIIASTPDPIVTQTNGLPSGSSFPIGSTINTFVATDANGNTASCSFNVTVIDNEAPIFANCPVDQSISNDAGQCGAVVNYATPNATDNCTVVPQIITFNYTGALTLQTYTVPTGVTSLTIDAIGARGGTAYDGGTPGYGGRVQTTLAVIPGQVLNIYVGGAGIDGNNPPPYGGYNGGGDGSNFISSYFGGGGGGATDIRIGGNALSDRVLVAGGGGGAGSDAGSTNGGDGGGLIAGSAAQGNNSGTVSATGGSQVAGGTEGSLSGWGAGTAGVLGIGGTGSSDGIGGGGGGGYYGGGGGIWAGGGGGSSYTDPVFTSGTVHTAAYQNGDGLVMITPIAPQVTAQTAGLPSGSVFPIGTTVNTFIASDANGNTSTCSFSVTVSDTELPVIACPSNIVSCTPVVTYTVTASDNCGAVTVTYSHASGSTFPLGTTLVKAIATDSHGNMDSCSFNVTINMPSAGSTTTTGCISYTWIENGNTTYTVSGVYTATFVNAVGCDSIHTLNLTIPVGVLVSVKALLEGPYIGGGLMHDSLRVKNMIPLTEPYTNPPYGKLPLGGASGESISPSLLAVTGNNAIVDWIFLELRSAGSPSTIIANKRALIQRDGDIVSTDGVSPVHFSTLPHGNYYLSVKHRNHIGIMTSTAISLSECATTSVDFTTAPTVYTNPSMIVAPRKFNGSIYTMWPGDANNNKNTRYNGLSNDKDFILLSLGGSGNINGTTNPVYRLEDVNMDGKIRYNNTDNDRSFILFNVGVSTPNTILVQHTPN